MADKAPSKKKRQRRICEYLGLNCTHVRTIFSLPQTVRFQIYLEAGLIIRSDINLGGEQSHPTHSLLLSCRAIYNEVSSVLYQQNRFFLRYSDFNSLERLRNLLPRSRSSLTHLTLFLHVAVDEAAYPHRRLRRSTRRYHRLLSEWTITMDCIKAHLEPNRLHLSVICDVPDIDTARQVALPLLSIPTLASCELRLSQRPDRLIRHLARETATRAMAQPSQLSESPFRIMDLPGELRREIFEHTDLVNPDCEIDWSSEMGFNIRHDIWGTGWGNEHVPISRCARHYPSCSEILGDLGCFCSQFHAAFTPECHCWNPPTSLFLVCRGLLEDARAVFYKKNRFVINPLEPLVGETPGAPLRLEASIFLRDIMPHNALRFLRDIEFVFPLVDYEYFDPHDTPYEDWKRTMLMVKKELCLPSLTVRVFMTRTLPKVPHDPPSGLPMELNSFLTIFKFSLRALRPLSNLKGLKTFSVHFAWPPALGDSAKAKMRVVQQKVERLIMALDDDSTEGAGMDELGMNKRLSSG